MLRTTLASFQRHNSSALAAGVAYYTLLSLFPLLIFAVSVLGVVMQDDARRREFTDDIISALPFEAVESDAGAGAEGATTELERNVRDAVDGVNGFSAVGLLGLAGTVWAASGLFATIRRALDIAWGVEEASRGIVHNKLVDVAMIAGIGLLLLASFALTTLVAIVRNVAGLPPELAALWQIAGTAITFGLTFAALMVMFRFVPDTDDPCLGHHLAGRDRRRRWLRGAEVRLRHLRRELRPLQRGLRDAERRGRLPVLGVAARRYRAARGGALGRLREEPAQRTGAPLARSSRRLTGARHSDARFRDVRHVARRAARGTLAVACRHEWRIQCHDNRCLRM